MVIIDADYLTCGQCLKEFPLQHITLFIQHKKLNCEDDIDEANADPELKCNNCPQGFMTAWALLVHAQLTHNLKIFLENASKTVLKDPDLPQIENGLFLPAIGGIENVEDSKTAEGEPMITDQKPTLLTNAKQSVNRTFEIQVDKGRDTLFNISPQLNESPQHAAKQFAQSPDKHFTKMGSSITVTRNIISNTDNEPNLTKSPEKNIKTTSPTEINDPDKTNQPISVSPPMNIYQVLPSSIAFVQNTNRTPFTLSEGQILSNNSIKVLPTVMVNPTSKVFPPSKQDSIQGITLVPHLQSHEGSAFVQQSGNHEGSAIVPQSGNSEGSAIVPQSRNSEGSAVEISSGSIEKLLLSPHSSSTEKLSSPQHSGSSKKLSLSPHSGSSQKLSSSSHSGSIEKLSTSPPSGSSKGSALVVLKSGSNEKLSSPPSGCSRKISLSPHSGSSEGSALVLLPQYSNEATINAGNMTKISQSSLPFTKLLPGGPFQGKPSKLDCSESGESSLITSIKKTDNENEKIEGAVIDEPSIIGSVVEGPTIEGSDIEGPSPSKKQCLDEDVEIDCCDSQDCGVKIIPVSHENLKKCCNAVVPKKRKRHMELKHMPFSCGRYVSRKLLYRSITSSTARSSSNQYNLNKTSANTIYIDLEPDSMTQGQGIDEAQFKVTQSSSSVDITTGTSGESSTNIPTFGVQSKQRSLILKPCSVFSIPLTYSIPTSQQDSNLATPPKSNTAHPLVDLNLETGSSILPSTSIASLSTALGMDENQSTEISQQADTLIAAADNVRNHGKVLGRSRGHLSKPFKCDKCSAAFNQRIHLQKHMSKHTGIKPYKCGECSYATVERSHLKVHIRIHTGEKPFKCTYCEYATAQNSTLKIHLKRHHGGKMFHCGSCDKQFTQKEQLEVHKWDHENKEVASPEMKISEDVKFLIPTQDIIQDAGTSQSANQMLEDSP